MQLVAARSKNISSVLAVDVYLMHWLLISDDVSLHLPIDVILLHRLFISKDEPIRVNEERHEGGVPLE